MQTGTRWGGTANPRDLTKTRQLELLREKQAREAAATVDIEAVRQVAYTSGHAAGYEAGFIAGWQALADHLVEIGVLEADDGEHQDDE
jgi:hypothetical protein